MYTHQYRQMPAIPTEADAALVSGGAHQFRLQSPEPTQARKRSKQGKRLLQKKLAALLREPT